LSTYRLYLLSPTGRITTAPAILDYAGDGDAVADADRRHNGAAMELWCAERLVAQWTSAGQISLTQA